MHLWRAERDRALARRHARAPRGAEDPQVRQARCLERTKTLIEDGELSRACRLLRDTGMAPLTPGVVDQLRRKHPPRHTQMVPDITAPTRAGQPAPAAGAPPPPRRNVMMDVIVAARQSPNM